MNRDEPKPGFNLSRWALDHPPLTRFLMLSLIHISEPTRPY